MNTPIELDDTRPFFLSTMAAALNRINELCARRTEIRPLTDKAKTRTVGRLQVTNNVRPKEGNTSLVFYICSMLEAFLESVLLDFLNSHQWHDGNPFYDYALQEITHISSGNKFAEKYKQFYGRKLKLNKAVDALYEFRHTFIHGSTRRTTAYEMVWLKPDGFLPDFHFWITDKYGFPKDSEFNYDDILTCNQVFNDLMLDIMSEMIRIAEMTTEVARKMYPAVYLNRERQMWIDLQLPRTQ